MKYVVETGYCILCEFMWWRQVMNGLGLSVWSMNFYSYALQYLGRHVYCLESIVSWVDQANWSWLPLYKGEAYCGNFFNFVKSKNQWEDVFAKITIFEICEGGHDGHLCISLREGAGHIIIRGQLDIHFFFFLNKHKCPCDAYAFLLIKKLCLFIFKNVLKLLILVFNAHSVL